MASPGATPGRSRGITPYASGTRPHTRRRSCMAAMHAMRRDAARAVQSPRTPVHAARLLICSSPPCSAGSEQPASWAPSRTGMQKTWWPWTCRARRALRRQRLRAPGPRNRCGRLRQGAGCTPPVLPAAEGAPHTPLAQESRQDTLLSSQCRPSQPSRAQPQRMMTICCPCARGTGFCAESCGSGTWSGRGTANHRWAPLPSTLLMPCMRTIFRGRPRTRRRSI